LNLEGWLFRGAVEYRLHSGSVEFGKIKNWIVASQLFTDKALAGKFETPAGSFDAMVEVLKSASTTVRRAINATGSLIHPHAKKKALPKQSSKLGVIASMLVAGPCSREEIAHALELKFGPETGKTSYSAQVAIKVNDFCSMERGFGWAIEMRDGKYHLIANQVAEEVEEAAGEVAPVDLEACDWLKARQVHFGRN
jgi:hypothetical protein